MRTLKYSTSLLLLCLGLMGCARDMNDLERYITEVKSRKASTIEPLPEIKTYPKYTYQSGLLRSPFMPDVDAESEDEDVRQQQASGPKRDRNRNKEFLEQFPLDSLQMVGTLNTSSGSFALIRTSDGLIHQVRAGNYIGENDGQVMKVNAAGVEVREIVPDGLGGYVYRPSEIPLEENI